MNNWWRKHIESGTWPARSTTQRIECPNLIGNQSSNIPYLLEWTLRGFQNEYFISLNVKIIVRRIGPRCNGDVAVLHSKINWDVWGVPAPMYHRSTQQPPPRALWDATRVRPNDFVELRCWMVELLMRCIECTCNKNKNMKINISESCFRGKSNLFVETRIFLYTGVMV